ncbi:BPSL0067 family protein [Janthinobacterium aquaticum]|uniref:BPSL0067 family protein n=1 Tax=Janthinobacterium sp. FT58W TaxID=2654254 RepID=UPI0012645FB5|nr:BPSL0067 family protein [Janthinobacterium sp. FT58W]KAB8042292.1 BPSL0067 family protein [Janthinobacterium sp. FT58W]
MSYTYTKVDDLEKTNMVGNHHCVALVRHYAGAPATLSWKQGEAVLGNRLLRKGTAIATFVNGKYANHRSGNHAALYMGQMADGILVMDQWVNKRYGIVSSRVLRAKGQNKDGLYIDPSNNADAFFVIE